MSDLIEAFTKKGFSVATCSWAGVLENTRVKSFNSSQILCKTDLSIFESSTLLALIVSLIIYSGILNVANPIQNGIRAIAIDHCYYLDS